MKSKKLIVVLGVFICIGITVVFFNKSDAYDNLEEKEDCRQCILHDYAIIGQIEDLVLKKNSPMNIKNLVWDVKASKDVTSTSDYDEDTINNCLSKLFNDVKYIVEIENQDIIEFKNNNFIPKNKGTTTAKIRITVNMKERYLCGPPPAFEEVIKITVE